ncbi:MAG: glycosyltransferase family 1 protein [Candidatus Aminicenantes bacterium]|nr:glycosyltransferase family 1 protein [Candidatus Aminicenantes bacterium]
MRIAIYSGTFKRNQDGATRTLYELTDTLLRNGIETGIWAYSLTRQSRKHLSLFKVPSIPLILYPDYRISFPLPRLESELDRFAPDVVHITVPDLMGIHFRNYARKRRIPILSSFHTDFVSYLKSYRLGSFSAPAWKYLQWLYNGTDAVLAPTRETANNLRSHNIRNVSIWSRGIHLDRFSPAFRSRELRQSWKAENRVVILFAGRFVWYKDLETFMQVYENFRMHRLLSRVRFVLAGDGPIKETLKKRMPEAVFPGYLSGTELSRVYASSDVFLFPSTTETFGNVIQEALASGLPALVSDQGGCQEIIAASGAGLVCPAGDVEAFSHACRGLINDPDRRADLRNRGLAWVRSRDWDRVNAAVTSAYRNLVAANDSSSPKTSPKWRRSFSTSTVNTR